MPLKPVFPRAPFTRAAFAYLPYTAVKTQGAVGESLKRLLPALCAAPVNGRVCAALLPAAYLTGETAGCQRAEEWLAAAVENQLSDGSYEGEDLGGQIALAQALTVWYEAKRSEQVLPSLLKFCQHVKDNWDALTEKGEYLADAGDLMQLFSWLYHVTGKKPLLKLMDQLRLDALDWTSYFHTFSVVKPMERVTPLKELQAAMEAESGHIGGFYTRQYYLTHGLYAAKSLKTPALFAQVSGNIKEKSAGKTGYEKIMRYHGTACGMFNADPLLAGGDPSQTFEMAAAGELAQSLGEIYRLQGENWAADALERVVYNALMAAEDQGMIQSVQAANTALAETCAYSQPSGETEALCGIIRGLCALLRSACLINEDDALVMNHLEAGQLVWKLAGTPVKIAVSGEYPSDEAVKILVNPKAAAEFELKIRIPSWCDDACVTVNDEGGDAPRAGELFTIKRVWNPGDAVTVDLPRKLRVERWYHQSAAVVKGAEVMAVDAGSGQWRLGLDESTIESDSIHACTLAEWDVKNGKVKTPPVSPRAEGEAVAVQLTPYRLCRTHIAQFPVVTKG